LNIAKSFYRHILHILEMQKM